MIPKEQRHTDKHLKAWEAWVEANINSNIMGDFVKNFSQMIATTQRANLIGT